MINKIENLNDRYVVCNKYNGKLRFIHKNWVTPTYDVQYARLHTEQEAVTAAMELNKNRKKCKFKIEKASKFFINLFDAHFDTGGWNSDNTCEIIISNKAVSLDEAVANKVKYNNVASFKEQLKQKGATIIQNLNSQIKKQTEELQKSIAQTNILIETVNHELREIAALDMTEFIKPYQTNCDNTYKVLYSDTK